MLYVFSRAFLGLDKSSHCHSAKMKLYTTFDGKIDAHNRALERQARVLDGMEKKIKNNGVGGIWMQMTLP
jgi:hypothetical protein